VAHPTVKRGQSSSNREWHQADAVGISALALARVIVLPVEVYIWQLETLTPAVKAATFPYLLVTRNRQKLLQELVVLSIFTAAQELRVQVAISSLLWVAAPTLLVAPVAI